MLVPFLLLLAASLVPAIAQTPSMNVPIGAFAVDASTPNRILFANVNRQPNVLELFPAGPGLLRSIDDGLTWNPILFRPPGQAQPLIYQVIVPPTANSTVYAFTDAEDGAVWKSTDKGVTWAIANTGLPAGGGQFGPVVRGANEQTLFGKLGDGFYRTTDGAATWTLLGTLANSGAAFAVDLTQPTANAPRTLYSSIRSAVYRSIDEGATWQSASVLPLGEGTVVVAVAVDPADGNTVLASAIGTGAGTGIYRSTDRGANFEQVTNTPSANFVFDPFPFRRGVVYASVLNGGCYVRSVNAGRNWGPGVTCLNQAIGGARIAVDFGDSNSLWAATGAGIYRTQDLGATAWVSRFGSVRPTLNVTSVPFDFNLDPNTRGRLELPIRIVETDRWSVPLSLTTSGESWLSIEGSSASTPFTAVVHVSADNLAPGTYTATIRVSSAAVVNSPVEVPVRLTVRSAAAEFGYKAATFAGTGQVGTFGDGGLAIRAAVGNPDSLAIDAANGGVLLSDPTNHLIRKVTPAGIIGRAAGNGQAAFSGDGGEATLASLRTPRGIAVDAAGRLYISDSGNGRIRQVSPEGFIATFAGATAETRVPGGRGLAVDAAGNLYAAFPDNHTVFKFTPGGVISRFAGTGAPGFRGDGADARFAWLTAPDDVAVDRATGNVYIADTDNHRIRVVTPDGRIRTVAGNGSLGFQGDGDNATALALARPQGIAIDPTNGNLVIADTENHRIRIVTREGRMRTIGGTGIAGFSGDGGPALSAQFRGPVDVAVDQQGNIYVADNLNLRVRHLLPSVVPAALSLAGPPVKLAPGGYFSIYGTDFTNVTASAASTPFPEILGGVSVLVNERNARLSFVSPVQINALVPVETETGEARIQIRRDGESSPEIRAEVAATAPSILTFGQNRAVAVNPDGAVNTAEASAPAESVITLYMVGIGLTDPTVGNGEPSPSDPLARPTLPIAASIGGRAAEALFLGLTPGFVGLAQANLKLPPLEAGDHAVVVTVGGVNSNGPLVTVQAP